METEPFIYFFMEKAQSIDITETYSYLVQTFTYAAIYIRTVSMYHMYI